MFTRQYAVYLAHCNFMLSSISMCVVPISESGSNALTFYSLDIITNLSYLNYKSMTIHMSYRSKAVSSILEKTANLSIGMENCIICKKIHFR